MKGIADVYGRPYLKRRLAQTDGRGSPSQRFGTGAQTWHRSTSDLCRKSGSRISPIGAGGLSLTPLIETERVSDPTIEAAKIGAAALTY
jgi:hypothetical protein